VLNPRHIEVQVLADDAGNTVHLGERECSLQRRHQKVIEESPSPLLDEATRARIGQAAVETAKSVDYRGAGTVEFIVSADAPDEFFFMEMNTRLQVEHPVTELVTGIDLVEWQLRIAAGETLDFVQDDVVLTGHAIEARLYAEDPERGFLPTGGTVLALEQPAGEGIRVDSALIAGLTVSPDYDPMLAKVIAWAPGRAEALRRLRAALAETVTLGVVNNVEFLRALLADPDVVAGRLDTELIERRLPDLAFAHPDADLFATAALVLDLRSRAGGQQGPWGRADGWRVGEHAASVYRLVSAGVEASVAVLGDSVVVDGGAPSLATVEAGDGIATVRLDGVAKTVRFATSGDRLLLAVDGVSWTVAERRLEYAAAVADGRNPELRSPMPGSVVATPAADGQLVEAGDPVVVVEAMKMEHVLRAPQRGTVSLMVEAGTQVAADQVVAAILPSDDESEGKTP
jgi:acetyl-CoA/propionyl-CoA carboxylase biotin carboxyl carrier protein